MFRVILKSAVTAVALSCLSVSAHAVEVYFFKGAGDFSFVSDDLHFSRGLTRMADTLNGEGIHSEVRRFGAVDDALETIRRRKPASIALVGHSMGALASMSIAKSLKADGIRIAYMGLIDIPGPIGVAGENVEWVENYFSIHPVYGKLSNARSHPKAANIHVFGYIHNRMDDSPKVQNGMLSAIRAVQAAEQEPDIQPAPGVVPETIHVQALKPEEPPLYPPSTASAYSPPQPVPVPNPQAISGSGSLPYTETVVGSQPYQLPVAGSGELEPQAVDPITTATIEQPSLLDRGRSLVRRAGSYVRNLKTDGSGRASTRNYPVER